MADTPSPFALPELGRSLRSLGSTREPCAEHAHAAVFGPLLDARAVAAEAATSAELLHAFRGRPIAARMERLVTEAAQAGVREPAVARARAARAMELMEPVLAALAELDARASELKHPSIRIDEYSPFVAQLRSVFAAADAACGHLAQVLAEQSAQPEKGWRRRGGST